MRERHVFREVEALRRRADRSLVTRLGLEVHVRVVARCADVLRPSFVADSDLDELADPHVTTMAAVELCLAGLWRRTEGGYVITDVDYVAAALAAAEQPRWTRRLGAARRSLWAELNSERFIPL
jgi:hypothetical protein